MKILVVSDSHGDAETLNCIIRKELPFDEMIFCGDGLKDISSGMIPKSFIVNAVTGNTDRANGFQGDYFLESNFCGRRIFVTHGDDFSVKQTYGLIRKEGQRRNVDCIIFGHTHIQYLENSGKPLLLNPGSVKTGDYAVMIEDDGNIDIFLKRV